MGGAVGVPGDGFLVVGSRARVVPRQGASKARNDGPTKRIYSVCASGSAGKRGA